MPQKAPKSASRASALAWCLVDLIRSSRFSSASWGRPYLHVGVEERRVKASGWQAAAALSAAPVAFGEWLLGGCTGGVPVFLGAGVRRWHQAPNRHPSPAQPIQLRHAVSPTCEGASRTQTRRSRSAARPAGRRQRLQPPCHSRSARRRASRGGGAGAVQAAVHNMHHPQAALLVRCCPQPPAVHSAIRPRRSCRRRDAASVHAPARRT
jgi:hypothetical protein